MLIADKFLLLNGEINLVAVLGFSPKQQKFAFMRCSSNNHLDLFLL